MCTGFAREKPYVRIPVTFDKAVADFYSPDSDQPVLLGPGGPAIGRLPPTRAGVLQTLPRNGGHLPERWQTLS